MPKVKEWKKDLVTAIVKRIADAMENPARYDLARTSPTQLLNAVTDSAAAARLIGTSLLGNQSLDILLIVDSEWAEDPQFIHINEHTTALNLGDWRKIELWIFDPDWLEFLSLGQLGTLLVTKRYLINSSWTYQVGNGIFSPRLFGVPDNLVWHGLNDYLEAKNK